MTTYIVFQQTGKFDDNVELVNRVFADSPETVKEAGTNGEYWAVAKSNISSFNKTADQRPRV
jgi:hypothetical protein